MNEDFLLSDSIIRTVATSVNVKPQEIAKNVEIKVPKKSSKSGEFDSAVIQIRYKDTEQKRAADTLAALMREMVEQSRIVNTARLRSIIQSVNQRLPQVKQELTTAEQNLENL